VVTKRLKVQGREKWEVKGSEVMILGEKCITIDL
jgi:hypothetical protein